MIRPPRLPPPVLAANTRPTSDTSRPGWSFESGGIPLSNQSGCVVAEHLAFWKEKMLLLAAFPGESILAIPCLSAALEKVQGTGEEILGIRW